MTLTSERVIRASTATPVDRTTHPLTSALTPVSPTLSSAGIVVLLLGAFLPIVDFFIVNVALPTIDGTLHASAPALELVVAGYGTVYAALLVLGGRLGDTFGRRRMFTIGLAGFTVASALCGLAPTPGLLIAARLLQGAAASLIVPQVLGTFTAVLDGPRRARALGLYGATAGVASVAGQLVGGLLVTADIAGSTWRPIFLVNVPIGAVVLLVARRYIPATKAAEPARLDWSGTALFALTLTALLVPLTEGRAVGWAWWMWLILASAPVFAYGTWRVEHHHEAHGRLPLLPPSLLAVRSMQRGIALCLPFFIGFGGFMFVLALTVQDGLHANALGSGLVFAPFGATFLIGSLLAPRVIARLGRRTLRLGAAGMAISLVWMVWQVSGSWPDVTLPDFIAPFLLCGISQALLFGTLFRLVLADVPPHLAGVGGGVMVTTQQSGLALGVATLGTLFVSIHNVGTAFGVAVGLEAALAVAIFLAGGLMPHLAPVGAPTVIAD